MTGLADDGGFKICIQVCMLPYFRPLKYVWKHLALKRNLKIQQKEDGFEICEVNLFGRLFCHRRNPFIKRVKHYAAFFEVWAGSQCGDNITELQTSFFCNILESICRSEYKRTGSIRLTQYQWLQRKIPVIRSTIHLL